MLLHSQYCLKFASLSFSATPSQPSSSQPELIPTPLTPAEMEDTIKYAKYILSDHNGSSTTPQDRINAAKDLGAILGSLPDET